MRKAQAPLTLPAMNAFEVCAKDNGIECRLLASGTCVYLSYRRKSQHYHFFIRYLVPVDEDGRPGGTGYWYMSHYATVKDVLFSKSRVYQLGYIGEVTQRISDAIKLARGLN